MWADQGALVWGLEPLVFNWWERGTCLLGPEVASYLSASGNMLWEPRPTCRQSCDWALGLLVLDLNLALWSLATLLASTILEWPAVPWFLAGLRPEGRGEPQGPCWCGHSKHGRAVVCGLRTGLQDRKPAQPCSYTQTQ